MKNEMEKFKLETCPSCGQVYSSETLDLYKGRTFYLDKKEICINCCVEIDCVLNNCPINKDTVETIVAYYNSGTITERNNN